MFTWGGVQACDLYVPGRRVRDYLFLTLTLTLTLTPLQVNTVMPDYGIETEPWYIGTVRVFRQRFTLEGAIGSHACSLEARACV